MTVMQRFRNALMNPAWVCFLWTGITIGVSMIATPVRFTAETITRPIALDVGRVVFAALNKAELAALVVLLIVVRVSGKATKYWGFCGVLALIAWVMARETVYTITTHRVAMRIGAALTVTLNLPFRWIGSADLAVHRDGTGTILLNLTGETRLSYLVVWPHVKPTQRRYLWPTRSAGPKSTPWPMSSPLHRV